jgi:hypothetical protein
MADTVLTKIEALLITGAQLAPMGGFEFSGYNARLQNKYLEWRKGCLEILDEVGPIGFPYKNKITADANGGFFFQSSTQLIVNCLKELLDKLKASPNLATQAPPAATQQATPQQQASAAAAPSGARVIKPPPKPGGQTAPTQAPSVALASAAPQPASGSTVGNKVYVIAKSGDPLKQELSTFLHEIGIEEIFLQREQGKMLPLNQIQDRNDVKYAVFIFNADDLTYAMFELGHFVGKLGPNHVSVLHKSEVQFPANVPGILTKSIVVKLEEISFSLIKELKAVGYNVSI